jgi:hypothetical protein
MRLRLLTAAISVAMVFTFAAPMTASAAGTTTWTAPHTAKAPDPAVAKVGAHSAASTSVHYLGGDLVTMRNMEFNAITSATTPAAKLAAAEQYQALGVFGSEINDDPDPYWWNYFYNVWAATQEGAVPAPNSDVVLLYGAGSPMQADVVTSEAYGGTSATLSVRPDVLYGNDPVGGVSYDDLIADLPENKDASLQNDYDPPQAKHDTSSLYKMSDSLYGLANAMTAAGKEGRYGDPFEIARQYEEYLKGMQRYILSKIADNTITKKTFVLINPYPDSEGLFQAYDISMGSGTASTVRGNEYLLNTATNLLGTTLSGKTKLTAEEIVTADIIVTAGAQLGQGQTAMTVDQVKAELEEALGQGSTVTKPILAITPTTTFGIIMNSCENIFGIPFFNGFFYPEVIDPVQDTMYLMENFWHISDDAVLASLAANAFENATLPANYDRTAKISAYSAAATGAKITAGLAYEVTIADLQLNADKITAPADGWFKLPDGSYKYFTAGKAKTGWVQDGGKWYYLKSPNGVMATGWAQDGSKWYYLTASGAMKTGWQKDGSKWYYLTASGAMKTGWQKDGSKWYYLTSPSGAMKTGWQKDGSKWYYLDSSGKMVTGTKKIGSKTYKFNTSGVWVA